MRKRTMLLVAMAFIYFTPTFLAAQMCGPGQCMIEPGMRNNMGIMSAMMGDMQQMVQSGKLTPVQQQHMLEMMNQMSGIMRNMCGYQGSQNQAQLQQQLQQLQMGLEEMKAQIKK